MTISHQQQDSYYLQLIENKLTSILERSSKCSKLLDAMRYSSLDGGKRMRPRFTIAAGILSNANLETTVLIGCAIELMHCFSLIHDDLPIIDNDDLRRGRPTNHKVYGEAIALLAGDALHALCFEILSSDEINLDAVSKIKIIHLLAQAIGVEGMVGGQTIDWLSTNQAISINQLQEMHQLKTGALLRAAILSGFCAGETYTLSQWEALDLIAQKIGLLFQIVDDIIDATEDTQTLGKTANKDQLHNKATYVNILGLANTQASAKQLYTEVVNLILPHNNHEYLLHLANCVYWRNS